MGDSLLKSKGNLTAGLARQPSGQFHLQQDKGHLTGRKPAVAHDFVDTRGGRAEQV